METYEIHDLTIKNMICSRCLKVIRQDLESIGVELLELRLGKIRIKYPKDKVTLKQIEEFLELDEFELVKDKSEVISEEVKLVLIKMVNNLPIDRTQKLSDFLAEKLHRDYWTLSRTFSKTEGTTIERYLILLRVEKAKELIEYDEMNFSEIAYELGYNNINHLSGQFKQVTGMSMSEYKQLKDKLRSPLDKIL
ncbi:MAG: AraC family transcriptional regulator [Lewinellaceae bacterium]|nr:AraC family transcriptional regulator [Saprospiraceae bacterium]MCB9341705.1 AraC family transcriptional regulator [Lewinellaceae bacterium]